MKRNDPSQDSTLGMDADITRRDFIGTTLAGAGAALLGMSAPAQAQGTAPAAAPAAPRMGSQGGGGFAPQGVGPNWTGPGGVGDYARSNGNTHEVVNAAHSIARGKYLTVPPGTTDTGEVYDVVMIGGGFAGLSAGYTVMNENPKARCLIIDNHPMFGGEGKMNIFDVDGQRLYAPQGSNDFVLPTEAARNIDFVHPYWDKLGLPSDFQFVERSKEAPHIRVARDNFGPQIHQVHEASAAYYYFNAKGDGGTWAKNPWETKFADAPIPAAQKAELMKFVSDTSLRKGTPKDWESWLDSMSYKDYIEKVRGQSPAMTAFMDMVGAAGAFACSASAYSAYGAFQFGYPGTMGFWPDGPELLGKLKFATFPGGNSGIARHFVKALVPDAIQGGHTVADIHNKPVNFQALDRPGNRVRIRLGATGVYVKHDGEPDKAKTVTVVYEKDGKPYLVKARSVVMCGGGWVNKHICRDLPDHIRTAYGAFHHGPMLTINVALRNWKFLEKLGASAVRWFGGEMGFWVNIRQPMRLDGATMPLEPSKPVVLSNYIAFPTPGLDAAQQGFMGRQRMFSYTYADLERWVREHYTQLFGPYGFDAKRDIAGIITNRWGHAYICPGPGFFFDQGGRKSPMNTVREGYGRVFFGHSETAGRQLWSVGVEEGQRASKQAMALL